MKANMDYMSLTNRDMKEQQQSHRHAISIFNYLKITQ